MTRPFALYREVVLSLEVNVLGNLNISDLKPLLEVPLPVGLFVLLRVGKCVCVLVQAPIKVFGVEGRYAHALFSAASQKNSLEKVEKELSDFQVCTYWELCLTSCYDERGIGQCFH